MSQKNRSASWVFGIILLVIGSLLFIERTDLFFYHINLPWWIFSWHTILIAIGIILLVSTSNRTGGTILICIGAFTLLPHWWPLLIILLGIYLITRKGGSNFNFSSTTTEENNPDTIDVVTIFGGCNKFFQSENFKGGSVLAAFGGSEINLYGCKLAEGKNYLDVTAIFGGSTIQAPSEWNIQIDVTPIFGGATDKRIKSPNIIYDNSRVLVVKGVAIFGGIDIKN